VSRPPPEPLARLRGAPLEVLGRIVESSNATFLVSVGELDPSSDGPGAVVDERSDGLDGVDEWIEVGDEGDPGDEWTSGEGWPESDDEDDDTVACADGADEDDGTDRTETAPDLPPGLKAVYKPLRGERPLWDFPDGLYRREVAAYELSVALGWDCVPGTVEREDAPLGVGSLQRFVDADFSRHYFALRDEGGVDDQLRRLCLFDILANNTDRKGGHVLVDDDDHVWGIDNALCFSTDARLRTVIWDYSGEPIADDLVDAVSSLLEHGLPDTVTGLLFEEECEGILHRARIVRSARQYPHDPTGRAIPWPLL
jgi:uncharacterized repeat protein (TIGR03843 family)